MPLVTDRESVLGLYASAAAAGWVVPTFCAENLTTIESVLAAAKEHGEHIGRGDISVTVAMTNLYAHRSQSVNYTHTRQWDIGLKLFLADLEILTSRGSPYEDLNVMVHLDHIQHGLDQYLLNWDLSRFSSIMFDASSMPLEQNIKATAEFMLEHGPEIVVEGACDEIVDAAGEEKSELTTPERAENYITRTGVDFIVANLGTEHRASAADLKYHSELARQIKARVGSRIVLHGCSSVSHDQVSRLFDDGVCKVNIWTALERDSSPALLDFMVRNAAKVAGPASAQALADEMQLGLNADLLSEADIAYFTTTSRQNIIFEEMKKIALGYFELWYK